MKNIINIFELVIEVLLIFFQLIFKFCFIDNRKKTYNKSNDNQSTNQMCPNIDCLVMKHEQTSYNLQWILIIESISISNVLIKSHKLWNLT